MSRCWTETRKIAAEDTGLDAALYLHVEYDDAGKPTNAWISTPGKFENKTIDLLLGAVNAGLADLMEPVDLSGILEAKSPVSGGGAARLEPTDFKHGDTSIDDLLSEPGGFLGEAAMPIGSRETATSKTDEWLTPPAIVRALGDFDLDPSAPLVRPWDTAAHHFTIADNSLLRRWFGRVWLNPPYSIAGRFMARLAGHGRGTALIFARTETEWWFRSIWPAAAALLFIEGRLNFHLPDGRRAKNNAGAPSVLVAYGQDDAARLAESGIGGKFVPLRLPIGIAVLLPQGNQTWREAVSEAFAKAGSAALPLDQLYRLLANHPKAKSNQHWRAKVRQIVQRSGFRRIGPGVYELEAS